MPMFTHVELHSQDPAAAQAFYTGVFGWKYSEVPMPGGSYVMVSTANDEPIGGIVQAEDKSAPDSWVGYVAVRSIKPAVAKAAELGANIIVDVTEIPGMGTFAILTDPRGGLFGIWEDAPAEEKAPEEKKKKVAKKAPEEKKKKVAKKAAKKKVAKKAAKKKVAKKAAKKKVAKKKK